jgi:putative peptidoglycan lipid II flippase
MAILKNVFTVSSLTLISRVFGYIRDIFMAIFLGAGMLNDAFIIAFRLPNLFRTIFGEGALNSAFVPIFASKITQDKAAANDFARKVLSLLTLFLVIFCSVMIFFMPELISLTAPGYKDNKEIFDLAVLLGRITFPYIFLISLVALYGGMLNSINKFYAFAAAPVLLNIAMIIALLVQKHFTTPAHALSWGVIGGGILELLWMIYFLKRSGLAFSFGVPTIDEDIKKLFKRMLPSIYGSGIAQINIWVSTIIASYVIGGISYLYFADRIYQLPLALIGTAMGFVLLPSLSKAFSQGNSGEAIKIQNEAVNFCLYLSIPATFAIMVMAQDIIHVLFERGNFTSHAAIQTANALTVFSIGLPAYVLIKVFSSTFFSNGDTKTPVKVATASLVINIIISISLLPVIQHVAIAVGSVISAWFTIIIFLWILHNRHWYRVNYDIFLSKILRLIIASLMMVLLIFGIQSLIFYFGEVLALIFEVIIGGAGYFYFTIMFKVISTERLKKSLKGN